MQSLDAGIALKRRIIEDLRPSTLSNLGLTAALEVLCGEFSERTEVKVHTDVDEVALADDVQLTAYRVVQEALTNVAKYAQGAPGDACVCATASRRGALSVQRRRRRLRHARRADAARGLAGMRFRVASHGGRLDLTSQPGSGTTIEAQLPQVSPCQPKARRPASRSLARSLAPSVGAVRHHERAARRSCCDGRVPIVAVSADVAVTTKELTCKRPITGACGCARLRR